VDAFVGYLVAERGLAAFTIDNHRRVAVRFLAMERDWPDGIAGVGAEQVSAFVLAEAARRSAGSLNSVTTALRALLRWLYLEGHTPLSLAGAVPAAPGWRDSGLPRAVAPDQIGRLLASCDRRTSVGRRDRAILTVLARLGLRAGEAAALNVDDLDWRAGEIEVPGKGNRRERLPLPVDVGQAIVDYCQRGRRRGACRSLFLHVHAPTLDSHTGVNRWSPERERAGLPASAPTSATAPPARCVLPARRCWRSGRRCGTDVSITAHYARDDQAALGVVARHYRGAV
jgi:site-specific recombinase XerC